MGSFNSIESVLRAYWRDELGLTDAALTLLADFSTKIWTLDEAGAYLFDMKNQEYKTVLRNKSAASAMFERNFEMELKNWGTEESEAALRVAVEDIIDHASMDSYEVDVNNSRFSIRVEHLAFLAESGDIDE